MTILYAYILNDIDCFLFFFPVWFILYVQCEHIPGLGFRRGSYRCECKDGFYFPDTSAPVRYYNGTVIEEEYEKKLMVCFPFFSQLLRYAWGALTPVCIELFVATYEASFQLGTYRNLFERLVPHNK
jgi:hypothetical protein